MLSFMFVAACLSPVRAEAYDSGIWSLRGLKQLLVPAAGQNSAVPLVITVSGLRFGEIGMGIEFKHITAIIRQIFPNYGFAPGRNLETKLAELHKVLEEPPDGLAIKAGLPPNYLEEHLRSAAERAGVKVEIVDFPWSQDPEDSETVVPRLKERLAELCARAKSMNRPVYLVTHSWGTVLAYDALSKLEREGKPVEIARFVTMCSPLVPHRFFVRLFKELEVRKEKLQQRVRKPSGVLQWVNLWAERDIYSDVIRAADVNVRIDAAADPYEARLEQALNSGNPDAKLDLKILRYSVSWHHGSHSSFEASFKSIGERVSWPLLDMFLGDILPQP